MHSAVGVDAHEEGSVLGVIVHTFALVEEEGGVQHRGGRVGGRACMRSEYQK